MNKPQPLSEDVAKDGFHHPSDVHTEDWKHWETYEGYTELNPKQPQQKESE